jgi:hypothetical protein
MDTCKILRGFLTLRDCGNPAAANCSACGRSVCSEHLAAGSGFMQCLDCHARASAGSPERAPQGTETFGADWAYGYRHAYYQSSGYRPIYSGIGRDAYYDDYDVRSFDPALNHRASSLVDDDERETGFGDS